MRCLTVEQCRQWREEHCRRRQWRRQVTCHTPLKRLPWFTAALVEQLQPFDRALLMVDQVVFDVPPQLERLRRDAGEQRPVHEAPGHAFENDPEGFRAVLEAALSGWVDFRALFSPSRHALRADHDEYTTFFSESSGRIAQVRQALGEGGVKLVEYAAEAP
jgi:hypothetical protein